MSDKAGYLSFHEGNLLSVLTVFWILPLLQRFNRVAPTQQNLFDIPESYKSQSVFDKLKYSWEIEKSRQTPRYMMACLRAFRRQFMTSFTIVSLSLAIVLVTPFAIQKVSEYLNDDSDNETEAYLYALLYAVVALIYGFSFQYALFNAAYPAQQLKGGTALFVFNHLLKMDYITINQQQGQLLSTIGADVEIFETITTVILLPCFIIYIIAAAIVLYFLAGFAGVIGLLFIVVEMVFLHFMNNKIMVMKGQAAVHTNQRIKLITNLIEGIRIIKLYSWEKYFNQEISHIRLQESKQNFKKGAIDSIAKALNIAGLGISLLIMVSIYEALGEELDTNRLFGAMTVLIIAHNMGTRIFAIVFHFFALIRASSKRLSAILLLTETKETRIIEQSKYAVRISQGSFAWKDLKQENIETDQNRNSLATLKDEVTQQQFSLQDISLRVRHGQLVMIIGEVGSGKTSLLLSMLGELIQLQGETRLSDYPSYATQEPWIISGTIKENILMGLEFDQDWFDQVIKVCQLKHDIKRLQNHEDALVGERGITLSGGQKARISIARALYRNSPIILLDDPLSMVDSDVGSRLFFECINSFMKDYTRILITHHLQYLQYADKIIEMKGGRIAYYGDYQGYLEYNPEHKADIELNENEQEQEKEQETEQSEKIEIKPEKKERVGIPYSMYYQYFIYGCYSIFIILLCIVVYVITQIFYFAVLMWIGYWADQDEDEQSEDYYLQVFAIIVAIAFVLGYLRSSWIMIALINASRRLHDKAFQGLVYTNSKFFDKTPQGFILGRFTRDIFIMDDILTLILAGFLNVSGSIIGSFIVMLIINWYAVFPIIIEIIFMYLAIKYTKFVIRQIWGLDLQSRGPILQNMTNAISGMATIRTMRMQNYMLQIMGNHATYAIQTGLHHTAAVAALQWMLVIGTQFAVIAITFILIPLKNEINDPNIGLVLTLSMGIIVDIAIWGVFFVQSGTMMSSMPRLQRYVEMEKEGKCENPLQLQVTKGQIEFKNVQMRYRKRYSQLVLNNLNFVCPGGKRIAIIGRTGAGKSSIMLALMRMYDLDGGQILIDGVDISRVNLEDLRQSISIIPQSPTLFNVNLRKNLDPTNSYSDAELNRLLEDIKLGDRKLDEMPDLSTGQKQLLCLGRAILRKTKILLLDEATASVDTQTDELIQQKISELYANCTIIAIAHRLRTIISSDCVVVMADGKVAEYGEPKELIKDSNSEFLRQIEANGETEAKELKRLIKSKEF